jgi:hypothetical protein
VTDSRLPISDLTLERYRLGELPEARARAVATRAAADADVRARLAALAASDAAFEESRGTDVVARAVTDRLARSRGDGALAAAGGRGGAGSPRATWPGRGALAAAAAAAAVVVTAALWSAPGLWRPTAAADPDAPGGAAASGPDRIKGDAAVLLVYRKAGASAEQLTDGAAAREGDLVRVAYRASSAGFGVIVSIDGRGVVTRHLPVEGDAAVALQTGEPRPLPDAYELDDAPRWERFYLVTSARAFEVAPVVHAAERAAASTASPGADAPATLALPEGFEQASFLLRKVS